MSHEKKRSTRAERQELVNQFVDSLKGLGTTLMASLEETRVRMMGMHFWQHMDGGDLPAAIDVIADMSPEQRSHLLDSARAAASLIQELGIETELDPDTVVSRTVAWDVIAEKYTINPWPPTDMRE